LPNASADRCGAIPEASRAEFPDGGSAGV
jgi:hypothetical protein